ncbi:MAG: YiiX family permuted papain-like enzyme [Zoogloeaceae bacterium]|nr:YiiX family permuted papain-like enzyme [Zoogloeaceae bacterium]
MRRACNMLNFAVALLCLVLAGAARAEALPVVLEGDIIFQTSRSAQSLAIQRATKSRYSHMGVIFRERGEYLVYEAVQPVKKTPLAVWIKRGADGKFALKRLRERERILTPQTLAKMKKIAVGYLGKAYDLTFEWDDKRLYCSELVWKIYKYGAELEIGKLQKLGDFDLGDKQVKAKLRERYGAQIPLTETVISPAAMFASEALFEPAF